MVRRAVLVAASRAVTAARDAAARVAIPAAGRWRQTWSMHPSSVPCWCPWCRGSPRPAWTGPTGSSPRSRRGRRAPQGASRRACSTRRLSRWQAAGRCWRWSADRDGQRSALRTECGSRAGIEAVEACAEVEGAAARRGMAERGMETAAAAAVAEREAQTVGEAMVGAEQTAGASAMEAADAEALAAPRGRTAAGLAGTCRPRPACRGAPHRGAAPLCNSTLRMDCTGRRSSGGTGRAYSTKPQKWRCCSGWCGRPSARRRWMRQAEAVAEAVYRVAGAAAAAAAATEAAEEAAAEACWGARAEVAAAEAGWAVDELAARRMHTPLPRRGTDRRILVGTAEQRRVAAGWCDRRSHSRRSGRRSRGCERARERREGSHSVWCRTHAIMMPRVLSLGLGQGLALLIELAVMPGALGLLIALLPECAGWGDHGAY